MSNETQSTALLVMDVQAAIIDMAGNKDTYFPRAQTAVDYAHAHGIRVIYVVCGFRPGAPEASDAFRAYAPMLVNARPVIAPVDGDVVVTKRRVSAFAGSDLDVLLRATGTRHLVLCGIATSGVVLSTLREAADKDFTLTVLSDLCADLDADVHRVLLEKVFTKQAAVMTTAEWIGA